MKILEIKEGKGFFLAHQDGSLEEYGWTPIEQIDKVGLMMLLNLYMNGNDIEMDLYQENPIVNPVQEIIYKSIFDKFSNLILNANKFKDDSDTLYLEEIRKYQVSETGDF